MDMKEAYATFAQCYGKANHVELAQALDEVDNHLGAVSDEKSRLEAEKEFLRVKLAEKLVEDGLKNITLANGKRFRIQEEMFVSATAECKPEVIEVLKSTGNGSIVREDFNAMTFKSLIKSLEPDEDGMPHPLLQELVQAGVKIKVIDMARRY